MTLIHFCFHGVEIQTNFCGKCFSFQAEKMENGYGRKKREMVSKVKKSKQAFPFYLSAALNLQCLLFMAVPSDQ